MGMTNEVSPAELSDRQSLSLEYKIKWSLESIRKWYEYWDGDVYVSVSGRDSCVLLDIAWSKYPSIPAVFCDTGMEFPEIRAHVRTLENVIIIRPDMTYIQAVQKYGWPLISKEVSQYASELRHTNSEKLRHKRLYGANNKRKSGKLAKKWLFLASEECPFEVSDKCCDVLKKRPFIKYERETGRKAMTGEMAEDSSRRYQHYLSNGCNAFQTNRPISRPLGFWTHGDVLQYVEEKNLPVAKIYDNPEQEHTGCFGCGIGAHKNNKFVLLKQTHPQLWTYCMDKLGMREVLRHCGIPYEDRQLVLPVMNGYDK